MTSRAATRGQRLRPRGWGIATRSAIVAATVVLVVHIIAGAALVALLGHFLISEVDDAAVDRLHDIVSGLRSEPPNEFDSALLDTDQRVIAIQVISDNSTVVYRSTDAPSTPLIAIGGIGRTPTRMSDNATPDNDLRIVGQRVNTSSGHYTVLVAGSSEVAEATVETVALLLCGAAPLVIAVVAVATYLLVKRSLRSVDAIRSRVADISTSDLSERVPMPESHDEIAALADTMNAMLARLEMGHNAQRQFVGDASHELRSPLTTIISALDVAQSHPELLDQDMIESTLVPEAQRMQLLIDDLLLLARADERGLKLHREDVDLEAIAIAEADRLCRETTHEIHRDITAAHVHGDARALLRLLRNLGDNAARHADSRIDITLSEHDGSILLTVADDGPGIPAKDRLRVFDRFVRLDSDRSRSGGGTGLGLSIVAEIVAAHDGSIVMTDRPGGGTAVHVQFPSGGSPDSSR
jgi:signal transduction histidine kinase